MQEQLVNRLTNMLLSPKQSTEEKHKKENNLRLGSAASGMD
jgi:hypothetical protein